MRSSMTAVVFLLELLMSQVIGVAAVPRRLRITNGCPKATMWIAHMAKEGPAQDPQNVRILPLQSYSFLTPDGLTAASCFHKRATYSECRLSSSHPDVDVVVTEGGSSKEGTPLFVIRVNKG